eukprot:s2354_g1.t1
MDSVTKGARASMRASMYITRKRCLLAYVLICLLPSSFGMSEDMLHPDSCGAVSLLQRSSTMASTELLHPVIMPKEIPSVLQSRGYDEAALLEMGNYMTSCFSTDYNEWTSCIANKCHRTWHGNYHVVVGVPMAWGASIRDLDSAYLRWGDYDAWIWSS